MKPQSRRFVVELKRGTNRAAFVSPDPAVDKFRGAEAMLFGGSARAEPEALPAKTEAGHAPGGRVLRSLVEPPPPTFEEMFPPVRRGRKPGSKNKPKPEAAAGEPAAERPRRGRKPGSKNKPKLPPILEPFVPSADAIAAMRSYGILDETAEPSPPPALPELVPAGEAPARKRARLRERSAVIRRYVLDTEACPGQPGSLRARRLARAGR